MAVLLNEIQRINYENGHINIVEIVKLIKARNENIITSYVSDCYKIILFHDYCLQNLLKPLILAVETNLFSQGNKFAML